MVRGKFITFEGGEGAGKSTQAALLAKGLRQAGLDVLTTREPGGAPGAEAIRALLVTGEVGRWEPFTEAMLNYAARHEHLKKTILPALEKGQWVISDRFADSTMAYQGYGHGLDREIITRLHRLVVGSFAPDLTLILDLDASVGLERSRERLEEGEGAKEDRYERMADDFHRRLREGFLNVAKREVERCAVLDAAGGVEEVQQAVRRVVRSRLGVEIP